LERFTQRENDVLRVLGGPVDDRCVETPVLRRGNVNVVFHLSSGDVADWEHALANVRNLLDDGDADVDRVELVANGDAVRLLVLGSPLADRVRTLSDDGVVVAACRNSLSNRVIPDEELLEGVDPVTSGVGELSNRQAAGDVYLKVP
jgi:hypothetical protein